MTGTCRKLILAAAAIAVAPNFPAAAQPAPPPTGPAQPLEYAVRFLCGPSQAATLAPFGSYFTTIGVHNPGPAQVISHKVALAAIASPSGAVPPTRMTDLRTNMNVGYDDAFDLDCGWIRRRLVLAGFVTTFTISGFVILQSARELDVVAVYTAGPNNASQVVTLHTERVPVRRVQ